MKIISVKPLPSKNYVEFCEVVLSDFWGRKTTEIFFMNCDEVKWRWLKDGTIFRERAALNAAILSYIAKNIFHKP